MGSTHFLVSVNAEWIVLSRTVLTTATPVTPSHAGIRPDTRPGGPQCAELTVPASTGDVGSERERQDAVLALGDRCT